MDAATEIDFEGFVLAASTADLDDEPDARPYADAVEFRMDLAAANGADPLAAVADYDGHLPLVATNRTVAEGGAADADEVARLGALADAAVHDAVGAVDVELAALRTDAGREAARAARASGAAVVASVHDFERTPATSTLRELFHEAATRGDVGKVSVTARSVRDAHRVLAATLAATTWGDRVAVTAMGEPGRHVRAVAPTYGSRIGYAPVDPARATAPGQYDLATLARLVDDLADPGDADGDGGTNSQG
jgi:3-dehydroquinate dehydratase-1